MRLKNLLPYTFASLTLVFCLAGTQESVLAELVLQPVSVTTNMAFLSNGNPDNVRDQSGLSSGYTSGVTDFDTYVASGVTHAALSGNAFVSQSGTTTGNLDFDLGALYDIESLAFWNYGNNSPSNVIGFNLLADDNSSFTSATSLGSFNANPNLGPVTANGVEVFTFAQTAARYVRFQITSNNGGGNTIFGELAFEGKLAAIPEPGSFTIFGMATIGLFARRRRSNRAR